MTPAERRRLLTAVSSSETLVDAEDEVHAASE
jgi:hypothetical protein